MKKSHRERVKERMGEYDDKKKLFKTHQNLVKITWVRLNLFPK